MRSGIVLSDPEVIEAMEPGIEGEGRFIPVKLLRNRQPSSASGVADESQFALLERHVRRMTALTAELMAEGRSAHARRHARRAGVYVLRLPQRLFFDSGRRGAYPAYPGNGCKGLFTVFWKEAEPMAVNWTDEQLRAITHRGGARCSSPRRRGPAKPPCLSSASSAAFWTTRTPAISTNF